MKQQKSAASVLTAILAVLISFGLISTVILTVVFGGFCAMLKPDNLTKLVQSIDYSALIEGFVENVEIDTSYGDETAADAETGALGAMEGEMLNAIMESDTMNTLIGEYMDGVTSVFYGGEAVEGLTADRFKEVVDENMDEIVGIVMDYVGDTGATEDQVRDEIKALVDESAEDVVSNFPTAEEIKESMGQDAIDVLTNVFNSTYFYMMIAVCAVDALLIYACRHKNFGGFMWVGVDLIIAGVISFIIRVALTVVAPMLIEMVDAETAPVISALLATAGDVLTKGTMIVVVIAVVCIAACIILRKAVKKMPVEGETAVNAEQNV